MMALALLNALLAIPLSEESASLAHHLARLAKALLRLALLAMELSIESSFTETSVSNSAPQDPSLLPNLLMNSLVLNALTLWDVRFATMITLTIVCVATHH